ncbi:MAG TPA: Clp protease N-terminal domain-containing protein [Acidimicrobiales bacterium]|nr:Clp protease N-terminal domain-containing protein [Acidimicrobiales bacterium]
MTLPLNAMTPRSRTVFLLAAGIAEAAGQQYVGTEHLLLALAREGGGVAAQVLEQLGVRERVMQELEPIIEKAGPSGAALHPGDEVRVQLDPDLRTSHKMTIAVET